MGEPWRLRPFDGSTDRAAVAALCRAALEPAWRLWPAALERLDRGVVAVDPRGLPVGFAATGTGCVPLLVVAPGEQRRGIGTALLSATAAESRAAGAGGIRAGAGGGIWPGVPLDLPGAVAFFERCGWQAFHDTLDLTRDLRDYRTPAGTDGRLARAGVTVGVAGPADLAEVLAFEDARFPSWSEPFRRERGGILLARDGAGAIVGTLLFDGPDADTPFRPMLGERAATIGCVGVVGAAEGRGIGTAMVARASLLLRDRGCRSCHIGWVVREGFYVRAGYRPWRRYRMVSAPA